MRILIVEDEDFSRQVLQSYLEQLGHDVVAASDGAEAWEFFQQEQFPIVITDWMMPKLDGLELVRLIRSHISNTYVYVILLTAKHESHDVVQGIMEGADDFLSKPYDRDELQVRVRAGARITELDSRLTARNAELEKAKQQLEETNAELGSTNRRMKHDLDAAASIQRSLLPTKPPECAALECAWIFRPCEELAGDIFNVFVLDERNVCFYLLDVVGHGVQAALLSVTLSRFLSPTAGGYPALWPASNSGHYPAIPPSEVAAELNRRFPMDEHNAQYFTLLFGLFDVETSELRFVSAGHPGPVYVPIDDVPRFLDARGFPVGISDDPMYEDHILSLRPGDRIVLYSDGFVEATNAGGDFFGKDRLIDCAGHRHESVKSTAKLLEDRVLSWCDGRPADDISALVLGVVQND